MYQDANGRWVADSADETDQVRIMNDSAANAGPRVISESPVSLSPGQYVMRKTYSDGTTRDSPISERTYLEKGGSAAASRPTAVNPNAAPPLANAGASGVQTGAAGLPVTQQGYTDYGSNAQGGAQRVGAPTGGGPMKPLAGAPPAQNVTPGTGSYTPVTVDYSRYDEAAKGYDRAVSTFQSELDRLSGVDPFGNQAFLRKATDRAAAQAGGLAAGGLSTATARAGNMRQAQGVQASLAAQGIEQQAVQRNADENQAAQLRLGAAGGLANTLGAKAQNEVELAKLQTQTMTANLDGYLKKYGIDATLKQQDVESLRQATLQLQQLGEQARQTDVDAMLKQYGIDEQTRIALKQISAQEHISVGEFLMGTVGAVAGLAGGVATAPKGSMVNPTSDRRAKFDVRDPDLRDLEDYLGRTKGKLYRYKEPNKPGRRAGLNFGPMAQDLAKTKIGRTVVGRDADGTYHVDAARLALADHAALAALAQEVRALKESK